MATTNNLFNIGERAIHYRNIFTPICHHQCYKSNNARPTTLVTQGLKRSVTTLRGGSLGYAEIVAVKVSACI